MKDSKVYIVIIVVFVCYLFFKGITSSIFLNKQDRIDVVFYGSHTRFYSLGLGDVSYRFSVPSNLEVEVPGGYGYYRIGALGKLISLEKKHDLYKKTFSTVSSSFVDLYFYPKENIIYYDEQTKKNSFPTFVEIFMNGSNANLLDRVLLWLYFLQKSENQYKEIDNIPQMQIQNRALFDRVAFFKLYQGFFYKKTHRNIKDRVQILYTKNYKTALLLSNILDGEGIQVVDLSETDTILKGCNVIYSEVHNKSSTTTKDIANFFGCTVEKGETNVSDIILVLGDLEKEWGVN
ncbi:hypothetical protein HY041_02190 [Candidatus Roizmanbacteria bacterium]|nr:hypothetical protein [Candidatus Roizmanbacteria bacterium]